MMAKCKHHPDMDTVMTRGGVGYCTLCKRAIQGAIGRVPKFIFPASCFVWWASNGGWSPISGTGCAHWVAHQKRISRGASKNNCLDGFVVRIPDLVLGLQKVPRDKVTVGDIWVWKPLDRGANHCGIVTAVKPIAGKKNLIRIKHDGKQAGGVVEESLDSHPLFKGQGIFYRSN